MFLMKKEINIHHKIIDQNNVKILKNVDEVMNRKPKGDQEFAKINKIYSLLSRDQKEEYSPLHYLVGSMYSNDYTAS